MEQIEYKTFNLLPEFGTNTYLIWDKISREAFLIDVASPDRSVVDFIRKEGLTLKYLFNTHGHGDHIAGNEMIKNEFDVPLLIHSADADMLLSSDKNLSTYWGQRVLSPAADIKLTGGEEFSLGDTKIMIIHTPGHSQGGISIRIENLVFSGDTLFAGSVGRTDLPGGNMDRLIKSIKEKLFSLPEDTKILPGHGPASTIETEMIENPFAGIAAKL